MNYINLYEQGCEKLRQAGIEEYTSDAKILFTEAFNMTANAFYFKRFEEIAQEDMPGVTTFRRWLDRRCEHEPVQYIVGNQDFCGLRIKVDERVLIPRLDTEVLIDELLKLKPSGKRILDLCTGSGCIVIAAVKLGIMASGVGTDISDAALELAGENARENGVMVDFLQGDLFEALETLPEKDRRFDVITANPPYIAESERCELAPEVVEHEPELALFAENNGLIFYERITRNISTYLNEGGCVFFEIGCSQGDAVAKLCEAAGLVNVRVIKDLAGLDRVVYAERN